VWLCSGLRATIDEKKAAGNKTAKIRHDSGVDYV